MEMLFLPETHQYFVGDEEVPHVTGILEENGLSDYSDVEPHRLEWARQRGTAVHLACQYYDECDLDESTLHAEVGARLEGWKKFRRDGGFTHYPGGIEKRVYSELYGFAGTIDRLGTLKQIPALLDIKASDGLQDHWGLQLAGYQILDGGIRQLYTVRLLANGDCRVDRWKDPNDRKVFLAGLTMCRWKRQRRK